MPRSESFFLPNWPLQGIVHALCSTRIGGVSQAPYTSLNLGTRVGDDPKAVAQNRAYLAEICTSIDTATIPVPVRPVFLLQQHTTVLVQLETTDYTPTADAIAADASISTESGLACTVQVADCLPVLFASSDGVWVAAAHAGWRGLQAGILEATVAALHAQAGENTVLYAWLGPCIGSAHFEVGAEVLQAFMDTAKPDTHQAIRDCFRPANTVATKYSADLAQMARIRLQAAGLVQIYGNNGTKTWCTYENAKRFFSHRRDTAHLGASGRMAACIWRK